MSLWSTMGVMVTVRSSATTGSPSRSMFFVGPYPRERAEKWAAKNHPGKSATYVTIPVEVDDEPQY